MDDQLLLYIEWLLEANRDITQADNLNQFSQCYLWGAVSEVYEALDTIPDLVAGEASDVLAYATLSLYVLDQSEVAIATNYSRSTIVPSVVPVLADLTNALSKWYRGDKGTHKQKAIASLYNLVHWASTYASVPVTTLAIVNQQKLQKRLDSTGTFQGSGDR